MYGIKEYEKIPGVSIGTLGNRHTPGVYINSMALKNTWDLAGQNSTVIVWIIFHF